RFLRAAFRFFAIGAPLMGWPTHGTAPWVSSFGALISKQTTSPQGKRLQGAIQKIESLLKE
ncbi:MAG TPA: hypothetical protein VN154_03000, partial [Rhizomicrobium sp.]|nr:hypothetical protein [Rhizomicrobium sp.]